jgi:GNAT superfamily N-acetyltransferase
VEDAGLNASAPPQQRWVDGWLVRFSPGKAKRARCINAVATGYLSVEDKLTLCRSLFLDAGLPMVVRVTPFSQPDDLDRRLEDLGLQSIDDTRVMVSTNFAENTPMDWPVGATLQRLGHTAFAQTVGSLRGSPIAQQQAHAQRLELSPVAFQGWAVRRASDGAIIACGQYALEADMVGLYDVFTAHHARGRGWSRLLCEHLLSKAASQGARVAYLQVDADNAPARSVYRRLGFDDAYAYHYRTTPGEV